MLLANTFYDSATFTRFYAAGNTQFRRATLFVVVYPQGEQNQGLAAECLKKPHVLEGVGIHFVSFESVLVIMLHCNMNTALNLQLGLDDLLADLRQSRKHGDLGRLAFIAYCEVRRWARTAGEVELEDHSSSVITGSPHDSREAFLAHIDDLIEALELQRFAFDTTATAERDYQSSVS